MDRCVFAWAKSCASRLKVLEEMELVDLDRYTERVGTHVSLYHDDETGEALLCTFFEKDSRMAWWKISNFDQLMAKHGSLTRLLLRNGEALYTSLTGGKDLGIVKMQFLRDKGRLQ